MPIYEYECGVCHQRFERLQKLSDPDPGVCPNCGATQIQKCVTAPAFRLSGTGWYETDFKKDGDKKRNLTDKSDGAGGETKAESKSESKPGEAKPAPAKTDAPAAVTPAKPATPTPSTST